MRYWFKRRRYGYGWTPATWTGWLLTLIYLCVTIVGALVVASRTATPIFPIVFICITTSLFVALTAAHSPKPKWRWGKTVEDDRDKDW